MLNTYITVENINEILRNYTNGRELDILSIDIDGNDWHVWNAVRAVSPRVVIIEYNGKFTPEIEWVMAYNGDHIWDRSDRQGASLKALERLGREKGYQLVGTNICGINAFFVRQDLAGNLFPLPATAENLYNPARMNLLIHHNGHPARNYVGTDMEGMKGVFEYYPDWNALSSFGFYKVEVFKTYQRNLICEKEALLHIRFIPQNTRVIRFRCSTAVSPEQLGEALNITFDLDGKAEKTFTLRGPAETYVMDVDVSKVCFDKEIIPVMIRMDQLWVPNKYVHNGDLRLQGLAVDGVEYILE